MKEERRPRSHLPSDPLSEEGRAWGHRVSLRARQRRIDLGLTQPQVVEALQLVGVNTSVSSYSRLETGKAELVKCAANLVGLALALDCSVTYLLGLSSQPGEWAPDEDTWPD